MRRAAAFALLLAFGISQTACMSAPRPVASPRTFIPLRNPERVWLTDKDGERVEVLRPRAMGDTLFGRTLGGEEVWIAFKDAPRIEARELDKAKTYAVVGGGIVAAALFIMVSSGGGTGLNKDDLDRPEMSIILFRR